MRAREDVLRRAPTRSKSMSTDNKPQRPKTAAQRASEANTLQQHAVRTNSARPADRQAGQAQLQNDHKTGKMPEPKQ
jgi:hypothetical protein